MLQDRDNIQAQAGFIGGLGLVGFVIGSLARRGRSFKRLLYTSAGAGGAASVCYPTEAKATANVALEEAKQLSLIAYNFVAGGKIGNLGAVMQLPGRGHCRLRRSHCNLLCA